MITLPFPHKGVWTHEELDALRNGYADGVGLATLAFTIGRSKAAVRNKAYEIGVTTRDDAFTPEEIEALKATYLAGEYRGDLDLAGLALRLGRPKTSLAKKARDLGLIEERKARLPNKPRASKARFQSPEELSEFRSEHLRERHKTRGHPFEGKTHSPDAREKISKKSKAAWAGKSPEEREAWVDKLVSGNQGAPKVARGTWKAGWREIGGKRNYYRSRWEANYARYLEWLKQNGEIAEWQHEPETFWFEAIKRGVRSYKPDFRVWEVSGQSKLHEVKGWMDARSKTTLKRMAKYHPAETVIVIREKQYNEIARKIGPMIEGWESGGRADRP